MRMFFGSVLFGLGCLSCGPTAQPQGPPRAPVQDSAPAVAPPGDAPAAPAATESTPQPPSQSTAPAPEPKRYTEQYTVCGCGCCGGAGGPAAREKTLCVSTEKLAELKAQDAAARDNPQCALMGCSLGTHYAVCE